MFANYRKSAAQTIATLIAVLALAGVHPGRPLVVAAGAVLIAVPAVVYFIRNASQIDLPYARKTIAALSSAVVGVGLVFNVDVSHQVAQGSMVLLSVSPLLVALLHNGVPSADKIIVALTGGPTTIPPLSD